MTLQQRSQVVIDRGPVAKFGMTQRIEQQVGDLRHRRNHDTDRPLSAFLRNDFGRGAHSFGAAHAGATEFHYEQLVQRLTSFPFDVRDRTSCSTFSSTSSSERLVLSFNCSSVACSR